RHPCSSRDWSSDVCSSDLEVGSQAISYTAGVPAAAAAMLIANGTWDVRRMVNVEELPPLPLLGLMERMGLSTRVTDEHGDRSVFADVETAEPESQLADLGGRAVLA